MKLEKFLNKITVGSAIEVLRRMPARSVHTCVTSPPYWGLRDYGVDGQLGLEATPEEFVKKMTEILREVRRVLRDDGTLWLNLGDSYNAAGRDGHGSRQGFKQGTNRASAAGKDKNRPTAPDLKSKDLVGIPWHVAFALQADGWYLRSDIIWAKPNPMPESVTDRPTKAHEYIFLMTKSEKYFYDADAIREPMTSDGKGGLWGADRSPGATPDDRHQQAQGTPAWTGERTVNPAGRNRRSVWNVTSKPFSEAHFATFPPELIKPCILAGAPKGGIVLDPFMGAGTTALVAATYSRDFVGIELNPEYADIARKRIAVETSQGKLL